MLINDIADKMGMNRKSVMLYLNKFFAGGIQTALEDAPGRGRKPVITDDEKAWIINVACQKPVDFGYSAETWNIPLLTKYINKFANTEGHPRLVHVLSYDEKPGIQAVANIADDLMPDENHSTISRDYEYKRLETVSLLAGIDLQTGEAIPLIREKHSSKEYIEFLKSLIRNILKKIKFV